MWRMKKSHKTDTMPDVLGAIKAAKLNDLVMVRACNKHEGAVYPNRQGLSECHITQTNND
jgi:hypothetical protein